jgi:hypothetical protein
MGRYRLTNDGSSALPEVYDGLTNVGPRTLTGTSLGPSGSKAMVPPRMVWVIAPCSRNGVQTRASPTVQKLLMSFSALLRPSLIAINTEPG